MQSHPDLNGLLANQRTADLRDLAGHGRSHSTDAPTALWRRLAGAALVRLGQVLLGEPRPIARSTAIPLGATR